MFRSIGIGFAFVAAVYSRAYGQPLTPIQTVPAKVFERILLVPVIVQGHGPYWFVLDTASPASAIDRRTAADAGVVFSDGTPPISQNQIRLDVGGVPFDSRLEPVDLTYFGKTQDQPIDGVLGMDFFRRFIVRLDYDAEVVSLLDPRTRVISDSESLPVTIKNSLPYINAVIKLPGKAAAMQTFLLDTSTGDAINDNSFAHLGRLQIGPDLGRATYLKIGPYRFSGVNGTSGSSKLGGELLHRFHLTLDIPHQRVVLTPNRHYRDAFLFDTSGFDIERSESGLKITRVFDRTPGKEAGLRPGDEILNVDGQSVNNFTVAQVRLMFREVGEHRLLIESDGTQRTIKLELRPLL